MDLIDDPTTLAERIVNAVCRDLYGRADGDHWFDRMAEDVRRNEFVPELIAVVQTELDRHAG